MTSEKSKVIRLGMQRETESATLSEKRKVISSATQREPG